MTVDPSYFTKFVDKRLFSYFKERRWQVSFYFILPVFMGSEPVQRTIKINKGGSRQISYVIEMIKTG